MKNDLDLIGPFKSARQFSANGDGFEAALCRFERAKAIAPRPVRTLPLTGAAAHLGMCHKRPWDYEVSVCIPTVNAYDRLKVIVQLLRLQTVKPFIILVDCGSSPKEYAKIEALRAEDLEVHALRLNGVSHSSEVVSIAMDLATQRCPTRFLFSTHDDCFLMSQIVLQYFRDLCAVTKICGHQLTPRPHDDWEGMVGHTALMLDMGFLLDNGLTWNMRRGMRRFGMDQAFPIKARPNWPDTEIGLNYLLRQMGFQPFLTGTEANWSRNRDGVIDHCRSAGSAAIYAAEYWLKNAKPWLDDAMKRAKKRIKAWSEEPISEVPPLPTHTPEAQEEIPHFTMGRFS